MSDPALTVRVAKPFEEVVPLVKEALKTQGFGVLTEIDMRATMQAKLGEEIEDYVILGACNPPLAFQALSADRRVGLLLPCNVVVRVSDGETVVEAIDPRIMLADTAYQGLGPVADDAAGKLGAALATLA
jgi:uncharacterized protein (DUF302 family)